MVLLKDEAKKSKVNKTKAYKQALKAYMKKIEPQLVYETWIKEGVKKQKVTQKELKSFFEKNKKAFNPPYQALVHHVLVDTAGEAKKLLHNSIKVAIF